MFNPSQCLFNLAIPIPDPFLNPGIRDWEMSNPGIPAGLWDPGGVISKTVIIEY